uniref:Uncharacterized protein n=2 Tax=Sphaerodactylus townsendi TaxID=933632 RepID=A0ACB8E9P7_9SAUR
MKVEVPSPRRPTAQLPKQGSLYHETAIEPADDIEAVTEILARRVSGLGSPAWLSLFEGPGPPPAVASDSDSNSSASPRLLHPPWRRPRTLSLDAKLSLLNGRSSRPPLPRTHGPSPSSSSSSSSGSPTPEPTHPPLHPRAHPTFDPRLWLQSQV